MIKLLMIPSRKVLEWDSTIPSCKSFTLIAFDEEKIANEIRKYKRRHKNSEGVFVISIGTFLGERSEVYYSAFVNNSAYRTQDNVEHILNKISSCSNAEFTVELDKGGMGKIETMSLEDFKKRYKKIEKKWKWLIKNKIAFVRNGYSDDIITFAKHSNFDFDNITMLENIKHY